MRTFAATVETFGPMRSVTVSGCMIGGGLVFFADLTREARAKQARQATPNEP